MPDNKDISVEKILELTKGKLISGDKNLIVENYSRDTRQINKGDFYIGFKGEVRNRRRAI